MIAPSGVGVAAPRTDPGPSSVAGGRAEAFGIIGAGPRGLSVLERLTAFLQESGARAVVHVIDQHGPGGRVWRADQTSELLMNTTAGAATLFLDDTVEVPDLVRPGPTLFEWASDRRNRAAVDVPELVDEMTRLTPSTSVSRRLYGAYLRWVFDAVVTASPSSVEVRVHRSEAVRIDRTPHGEQIALASGEHILVDALVLALGHVDTVVDDPARVAADSGRWVYVPPGHPAEQRLDDVAAGENAVVRGLGLNFFDLMALLTIGRGGVFSETEDGKTTYARSGREPVLWVGSRRGIPFKAKPMLPQPPLLRRYPSDRVLDDLRARRGQLDFDRDIWPWVRKEAVWQASSAELPADATALRARLTAMFDEAPHAAFPDPADLREAFPGRRFEFDPDRTGDRLAGRAFASTAALDDFVRTLVDEDLQHASDSSLNPTKAGDGAIGASRLWIFPLAEHGGLDGTSHLRRFAGWFEGYANSLAGGPPALRLRQLSALMDAGVVRMLGADLRVEVDSGGIVATSPTVPDVQVRSKTLIDARLPDGDIRRARSPLIRNLLAGGRIRQYVAPASDGVPRTFPGIDVAASPFAVLDRQGVPDPRVFAIGVPIGPHVGTSLTGYARANAGFFRQTDAVARAMLAVATVRGGRPGR